MYATTNNREQTVHPVKYDNLNIIFLRMVALIVSYFHKCISWETGSDGVPKAGMTFKSDQRSSAIIWPNISTLQQ